MDSPKIVYKYYSNPAFCGQSEVVYSQKTPRVSSKICTPDRPRMQPLGANSPRKIPAHEKSNHRIKTDISDNPLRISKYAKDEPPELPPKPAKFAYSRTNSNSSFHRQSSIKLSGSIRSSARCRSRSEELEMSALKIRKHSYTESDDGIEERTKHRYEIIADDLDDIEDYSPTKKRIIEADAHEIEEYNVDAPDDNEMKEIPTEIVKTVNGRTHRYAIVPSDDDDGPIKIQNATFSPKMSKKNLIATQKLHELLSTPRKPLKSYGSQPSVRMMNRSTDISPKVHHITPSKKMTSSTPTHGITPSKSCANLSRSINATSPINPKALQKLNYGTEDLDRSDLFVRSFRENSKERSFELDRGRLNRSLDLDRRCNNRREFERRIRDGSRRDKTTAVITPRLALPSPSEYSEETYKSFTTLKYLNAASATLAVAALMMTLCGGLSAGLSFYIMYTVGRRYYLDFGVLSGFTCLLLGLLGFRSRKYQLLPNRNYISGYIVLSVFSLLSAGCLLILLCAQPRPGSALSDVSGGAVCALSALSLSFASLGVFTSYCCRHPPPDNRVANGRTKWY